MKKPKKTKPKDNRRPVMTRLSLADFRAVRDQARADGRAVGAQVAWIVSLHLSQSER